MVLRFDSAVCRALVLNVRLAERWLREAEDLRPIALDGKELGPANAEGGRVDEHAVHGAELVEGREHARLARVDGRQRRAAQLVLQQHLGARLEVGALSREKRRSRMERRRAHAAT